MKYLLSLLSLLFLFACTHSAPEKAVSPMVQISEIRPDRETELTKQNLTHLIRIYDLAPFFYTYKIHIEKGVHPRSHPILTLNTAYAENPSALLAQWLHEEFHWWANSHPSQVRKAIEDLKIIYPKINESTGEPAKLVYLHFIVNSLELRALTKFLGKKDALKVIKTKIETEDHYRWVYETVLVQADRIQAVIVKNKLLPPALR